MKLNNNTLVPKIIEMNTEISIIDRSIDEAMSLLTLKDELEFISKIQNLIEKMPKLKYFDEEINSIKECLVDIYDGYEKREDGISYMNFMKRVIASTRDYIGEMR